MLADITLYLVIFIVGIIGVGAVYLLSPTKVPLVDQVKTGGGKAKGGSKDAHKKSVAKSALKNSKGGKAEVADVSNSSSSSSSSSSSIGGGNKGVRFVAAESEDDRQEDAEGVRADAAVNKSAGQGGKKVPEWDKEENHKPDHADLQEETKAPRVKKERLPETSEQKAARQLREKQRKNMKREMDLAEAESLRLAMQMQAEIDQAELLRASAVAKEETEGDREEDWNTAGKQRTAEDKTSGDKPHKPRKGEMAVLKASRSAYGEFDPNASQGKEKPERTDRKGGERSGSLAKERGEKRGDRSSPGRDKTTLSVPFASIQQSSAKPSPVQAPRMPAAEIPDATPRSGPPLAEPAHRKPSDNFKPSKIIQRPSNEKKMDSNWGQGEVLWGHGPPQQQLLQQQQYQLQQQQQLLQLEQYQQQQYHQQQQYRQHQHQQQQYHQQHAAPGPSHPIMSLADLERSIMSKQVTPALAGMRKIALPFASASSTPPSP